jgi:hypothetical protein
MLKYLFVLLMVVCGCTSNLKVPSQMIAVGISARASDICNDLIDQEIAELVKIGPQHIECARRRRIGDAA